MTIVRRVNLSRVAMRLMLAAGAAALVAGCSDASRFSADPFSDPFERPPRSDAHASRVDRAPTGSIASAPIQSQPLAPPAASASSTPRPASVAQAAPPPSAGSYNHWSAEGGTPITVAEGDTPAVLGNRYGVPTEALLKVNGYSSASQVQPGSRLVIPVYRAGTAKSLLASESHGAKEERAEAKPSHPSEAKRVAAKRDEDEERKAAPAKARAAAAKTEKSKLAAKSEDDEDQVKPGKKEKGAIKKSAKTQVGKKDEDGEKAKTVAKTVAKAKSKIVKAEPEKEQVAPPAAKKQPQVAVNEQPSQPAPTVEARKSEKSAPAQEERASDSAHPEFRWPARGRIIQGFASGGNDGINIAVPEGTQVKAAEAGVVAYAGNELKGYGNLVLIRHPNGFVTAYAHNGDLNVKRGDQVTRGQTIAKSGQSGNVATPQLHFELRKGSTPVDPTTYLATL